MPRPRKCRKVCRLPDNDGFLPLSPCEGHEAVVLTVDEYECIRLADREGLSQEQCGEAMHIGRATVQQIYTAARKKLADALVEGRPIRIAGGDYRLCNGDELRCGRRCPLHRERSERQKGTVMKIAIPLDETKEQVCAVLSRAPYFLFWADGREAVLENPAAGAEGGAGVQAAQFLVDQSVTVLVAPRCGQNAADVLTEAGVKIYQSAHKAASDDLKACLDGTLGALTHVHGGYHGIR